jgi:hypothetical protein
MSCHDGCCNNWIGSSSAMKTEICLECTWSLSREWGTSALARHVQWDAATVPTRCSEQRNTLKPMIHFCACKNWKRAEFENHDSAFIFCTVDTFITSVKIRVFAPNHNSKQDCSVVHNCTCAETQVTIPTWLPMTLSLKTSNYLVWLGQVFHT